MKKQQTIKGISQAQKDFLHSIGFDYDEMKKNRKPSVWQWKEMSVEEREILCEQAVFNAKAIKKYSKMDEIETWMQSVLSLALKCVTDGFVELKFD